MSPALLLPLSLAVLAAALLMTVLRLLLGPSLADRLVALELLASIVIGVAACYAVLAGLPVALDLAVVLALTSFLGAIALSRYLERRGEDDGADDGA